MKSWQDSFERGDEIMTGPFTGKASDGRDMHYVVGALVEKEGKYLLIDRAIPPPGYAGPAGHIDKDENGEPEDTVEALKREVKEETGYEVEEHELLLQEEVSWNWCSKGVEVHYWNLFKVKVKGEPKRSKEETKSMGWYTPEEIKDLELEKVWKYWFEKLDII